jgi:hypothetical protein
MTSQKPASKKSHATPTATPQLMEIGIELSDEERENLTAKAASVGLDLEAYIRVRMLTHGELPEPSAFLPLVRRLSSFAQDYEACMRAFAKFDPDAQKQSEALGKTFARLLQDWDELYGPR